MEYRDIKINILWNIIQRSLICHYLRRATVTEKLVFIQKVNMLLSNIMVMIVKLVIVMCYTSTYY